MIAVVDYGAGNTTSVRRALDHLGHECLVTTDPAVADSADRIIVPGVGHFATLSALSGGALGAVLERRLRAGAAVLGICLGLQWLFESSEEAPGVPGLGLFPGRCRALPVTARSPHMGWDEVRVEPGSRLFEGLATGVSLYFAHSYVAPLVRETVASCDYGIPHSAAVERGDLFAVQFHPEKSGRAGLTVLDNFCTC